MSARIKVDEDLPRQIADILSSRGHDAVTVLAQGWQGTSDDLLWHRVQAEGRWLITADKEFADLRRHPPGSHAGVILLRPQEENRRAYLELAATTVDQLKLEEIAGAVAGGDRARHPHPPSTTFIIPYPMPARPDLPAAPPSVSGPPPRPPGGSDAAGDIDFTCAAEKEGAASTPGRKIRPSKRGGSHEIVGDLRRVRWHGDCGPRDPECIGTAEV